MDHHLSFIPGLQAPTKEQQYEQSAVVEAVQYPTPPAEEINDGDVFNWINTLTGAAATHPQVQVEAGAWTGQPAANCTQVFDGQCWTTPEGVAWDGTLQNGWQNGAGQHAQPVWTGVAANQSGNAQLSYEPAQGNQVDQPGSQISETTFDPCHAFGWTLVGAGPLNGSVPDMLIDPALQAQCDAVANPFLAALEVAAANGWKLPSNTTASPQSASSPSLSSVSVSSATSPSLLTPCASQCPSPDHEQVAHAFESPVSTSPSPSNSSPTLITRKAKAAAAAKTSGPRTAAPKKRSSAYKPSHKPKPDAETESSIAIWVAAFLSACSKTASGRIRYSALHEFPPGLELGPIRRRALQMSIAPHPTKELTGYEQLRTLAELNLLPHRENIDVQWLYTDDARSPFGNAIGVKRVCGECHKELNGVSRLGVMPGTTCMTLCNACGLMNRDKARRTHWNYIGVQRHSYEDCYDTHPLKSTPEEHQDMVEHLEQRKRVLRKIRELGKKQLEERLGRDAAALLLAGIENVREPKEMELEGE